jgi:uncharacterized protein
MADTLTSPHILEYPYERSTGPIIGAFLGALRDRRVVGIRARDGRVLVPPQEYDPQTAESLDELVAVSDTGTLVSWSWNPEPRPGQPLDRPFAWGLVRLDGADTPLLHALDCPREDLRTGMRVRIRWADEPRGAIGDIAAFEPGEGAGVVEGEVTDAVTHVGTPMRLEYTYTAGPSSTQFLRGTQERRLLGRRCSECAKVYLPPRGVCSMCGAAFTDEIVEVSQVGTVATFAVVNVNFASRQVDLPYAAVEVLFDGADITSQFLILGVPLDEVRMGMRVRAVWKDGDLEPTMSNITHVEPVDEPDAPFESFQEHV